MGTAAIHRFARPVCYQDFPEAALPEELRDANPRGIWRLVDGASDERRAVTPASPPEAIEVVDSHTEGEPTRVVIDGLAAARGPDHGGAARGCARARTACGGPWSASRAGTTRSSARC